MKRIYFPEKFKPDIFEKEYPQGAVYALGFFDGVHIAHRALISEAKKAEQAIVTPNCREKCSACGANCFKGGVCYE